MVYDPIHGCVRGERKEAIMIDDYQEIDPAVFELLQSPLPLFNKKVYLSGPIDYVKDGGVSWRASITPKLQELGLQVFDPTQDPKQNKASECHKLLAKQEYDEARNIIRDFVRKDLAEVDHSHVIIAKITLGVMTTGTVHEIINATNAHKPVIIFCDDGKHKIPAWYYGIVPHEFFFNNEDEVINYLQEVNDGKHKEKRRWSYVYGLV